MVFEAQPLVLEQHSHNRPAKRLDQARGRPYYDAESYFVQVGTGEQR
jgi:hypothetical protein